MSSILHRIGVEGATTTDVYDALTTIAVSYTHLTLPTNREV